MKVGICPGIAMFEIGNQRVDLQVMHQMWFRIFCRTWGPFIRPVFHFRMGGLIRGRLLFKIKKCLFILGAKRGRRANNRICYSFVWARTGHRGLWRGNLSSSMSCKLPRGLLGRDCMVVGFITTYAISAYHQWLATGRLFSPGTLVSSPIKLTAMI